MKIISALALLIVLAGCGHWIGPNGRKVVGKGTEWAHYEKCRSPHVLQGYDDVYPCWIDTESYVVLEGYGKVPVDTSCVDRIQLGATWNNDWKWECN